MVLSRRRDEAWVTICMVLMAPEDKRHSLVFFSQGKAQLSWTEGDRGGSLGRERVHRSVGRVLRRAERNISTTPLARIADDASIYTSLLVHGLLRQKAVITYFRPGIRLYPMRTSLLSWSHSGLCGKAVARRSMSKYTKVPL